MSKKRGKEGSKQATEQESTALSTDQTVDESAAVSDANQQPETAEPRAEDSGAPDAGNESRESPAEPQSGSSVAGNGEPDNSSDEPASQEDAVEAISRVSDEQIQAAAAAAATRPSPHLKQSEASVARAASATASTANPSIATGGRSWLALIALLLALVACLGVLALVYMDRDIQYYLQHRAYPETEQQLETELKDLATRVDSRHSELSQELEQKFEGLASLPDAQQQLQDQLAATDQTLTQNSERLQRQLQELQRTSRDDWQLAEVEYLLRLANQRLLTEGDVGGVEALLASADLIVRNLDNVSLFPVREALAADLVAVRAVPKLDQEGVYLQLAALADEAMRLPLLPVGGYEMAPQETEDAAQQTTTEEAPLWQRLGSRMQQSFSRFKQYFRLNTQRSEPLQELLTPNEEVYLRQNLRLMMEQAQLALLKGQQRVYDASLSSSLDWLQQYFSYNNQASLSMVQQLEQLQSLQLNPELPDISGSLKAIQAFNEQLHRREEAGQ
ncbi:uroporphyrinogen-III C-methyltransferase [Aestuariirhabdus sp. Z084]|uniref:uroporphyrinogen-III C-methyltransferase n=1 Tax=Aestuariirhabdus haliotis TaxID=2918751 RepID=UPI00201B3DF0|nr:uroporphyrinogen-III C-methyltransferase [Aestuariirhabdus haliotis]MCL6416133.1 uroporphyrinogen-III C-methyltransferase [Aestuariirhabdus haliotis]MCL6420110.1 uroporphyrinogen-III C-methyltransferase [Aestuariirhabdus haliotis]